MAVAAHSYRCLFGRFDHTSGLEAMREAMDTIDRALGWRRKLRLSLTEVGLDWDATEAELAHHFGPPLPHQRDDQPCLIYLHVISSVRLSPTKEMINPV